MKRSKLIALSLIFSFAIPVSAIAATDEQWTKTPPPTSAPSWGIVMNEDTGSEAPFAELSSVKADSYINGVGKVTAVKFCKSFEASECPRDQYQRYTTPVGFCMTASDPNCVEEVIAQKSDGTKIPVQFLKKFPDTGKYDYVGDPQVNLPSGATTFLVDIPGAPHAGGSSYLVVAVLNGEREPGDSSFRTGYLTSQIFAVTLESGTFSQGSMSLDPGAFTSYRTVSRLGGIDCTIQCSDSQTARAFPMPIEFTFGLKIRLTAKVTGWLNGRVSNIETSIEKDSSGRQILAVSGKPVVVPTIFGWQEKLKLSKDLETFYANMDPLSKNSGNGYGGCLDPNFKTGTNSVCNAEFWESTLRQPGKNLESIKEIALWLPAIKDKAVAAPTMWLIASLGQQFNNGCAASTDRVSGIVTTNATGYVAGPPDFNAADQTLDYKVIAPHYLPDDKEFKGTYDLSIESDFARCLYGFSKAPISATVSIISDSGATQVATTVVSQRGNWMHLGAYGFGFSSPTLKVKFTQEKVVTTVAKPVAKKVTITCVKGKTIKKVSAIKPTCPAGYKKK